MSSPVWNDEPCSVCGCDACDCARHVRTSAVEDGGCMTCDECDLDAGHDGGCDCGHVVDANAAREDR
jgi:hypothetical protein